MSDADQSTTSDPTTRRRLLRLLGAGGAALVATTLPLKDTEATHDAGGTDLDALHVGQTNGADATTTLLANITDPEAYALAVENQDGPGLDVSATGLAGRFESQDGQALQVSSHGGNECAFAGWFTAEDAFGLGAFSRAIGMKAQGTRGAFIGELLNEFAADDSPNAAVVGVAEASGVNCPLGTPCTSPGSGVGVRGIAGAGTGIEGISLSEGALIHVGDCAYQIPLWEPLAGPLGSGIGVLGRSGTGTGVSGQSENGIGVAGYSEHGTAGFFQTGDGQALAVHGPATFEVDIDNAAPFSFRNINTGEGALVIWAQASGLKPALLGSSDAAAGVGVAGTSDGPGFASGEGSGDGVSGKSGTGAGVVGRSTGGAGVRGESANDKGVLGVSNGASPEAVGVYGYSADGIGLKGESAHVALDVLGRARFSTAGSSAIPAGDNAVAVASPAVTANSHVTVTLTGNPGPRQLLWVERNPGSGFTVHLTSAPPRQRPETSFTYLIVEPAV